MNADIRHVVLLLLENHSFDQVLGALPGVDGVSPEHANTDADGRVYRQAPTTERQTRFDPKHELDAVAEQLAGGNAGFVRSFSAAYPASAPEDRQEIMGYYPAGFLPALHALAADFTVCDRWFASVPGPTWTNRFLALTGTSMGRVRMPQGMRDPELGQYFAQDQDTLFDRLSEAGRSWRIYFYDFPSSLLLTHQRRPENLARYRRIERFFADALSGELPEFSLIEPKYFGRDQNDDHPPHNVIKAEKLVADVYDALRSGPDWPSTLLVVYFDEHGGFYDHVPPPPAVPPDDHHEEFAFDRLGVRVPALLVSPWAARRVEHTVFDHTSVLRFLSDLWGLGPLGARTAQAASVGVALAEERPRQDTVPFVRVPYTDLMPEHDEWERHDTSAHHRALGAFAYHLARSSAAGVSGALAAAAAGASPLARAKAALGRGLASLGGRLTADLEGFERRTSEAVLDAVTRRVGLR